MENQNQHVVNQAVQIYRGLEKEFGKASLERLWQLTAATIVAAAMNRVADAIERQNAKDGRSP